MDDDEATFFSRQKRKWGSTASMGEPGNTAKPVITFPSSDSDTDEDGDKDPGNPDEDEYEDEDDHDEMAARTSATAKETGKVSRTQQHGAKKNAQVPICLDSSSDDDRPPSKKLGRRDSRTRSESLTPPPKLSPRRILAGQRLVQDAFLHRQQRVSRMYDEPAFTLDTNPEEARFELEMRQRSQLAGCNHAPCDAPAAGKSPITAVAATPAPNAVIEVVVRGVYVDLPEAPNIIQDVKAWETPRMLKIRLDQKLSIAKVGYCKEAGMSTLVNGIKTVFAGDQHRIDQVVLIYRGVRIFDYSTAHDLGIAHGEQPFFEAHTKEGWRYLSQNPQLMAHRATGASTDPRSTDDHDTKPGIRDDPTSVTPPARTAAAATEEYTKLTLRSQNGKELKIRVRASTKVSGVIDAFKAKHSIPPETRVELRFEGDALSGIMGDTDVESDDVIDVLIH